MDSDEADIKPVIPEGDLLDKRSFTPPCAVGLKLKQSRYEDVWPEDVHAAFMEAVALYPPMGKRRLKYYRVSIRDHPSSTNHAKSFGRCQLIQSYILEKTGKNRSRKQVSSHLQRLKKIHKDNPAMCYLFSELSHPPSEHRSAQQAIAIPSQDICTNIPSSAYHLKNDFDLNINFQNKDQNVNSLSSFSQVSSSSSSSSSMFDLSTNFHDQSPGLSPQDLLSPQQLPAGTMHPSDSDYLSQLQDPLLFTDTINGIRSSSAFSMSARRLASKLPVRGRQLDSGPTAHFPCAVYFPGFQPTYQWFSYDGLMDGIPRDSPLTAAQQAFHTSLHHHPPPEKRLNPGLICDLTWPQTPIIPPGREGEPHVHCPTAIYQYNPTYPTIKVNSPSFRCSPPEGDILRFPRGIAYSYATATPVSASDNVSNERTIDFLLGPAASESSHNPVSSSVIRPTPVYPMSYSHPDGHTPASNFPYLIN